MGQKGSRPDADADLEEDEGWFDRNKTFKPKRKIHREGTQRDRLHKTMTASMKATLGGQGDMATTVKLPDGEDPNEWLAVNTVHFFNAASLVYGTVSDFCTAESCPDMTAGPRFQYRWADGVKVKRPISVSAPEYIDLMFGWVDEIISNPDIFPVEEGASFPSSFKKIVKHIFKRLFRMYAHIYYSHFEEVRSIGAEAHLNTCFKHLIYFILEFDLVDPKELVPLHKLIKRLVPSTTIFDRMDLSNQSSR
ncbi:MAG: hypothetical protein MHM6MM_000877 [Cercozoa sp. M6MM]